MTKLLLWLERRIGRYAIENLTSWLIAVQVALWVMTFWQGDGKLTEEDLRLIPEKVFAGEFWRVFTVIVAPPSWYLLFWFLFWNCGTSLEAVWGAFRYNFYMLVGWAVSVIAALATGSELHSIQLIAVSVLLAWNRLAPGLSVHFFGGLQIPIGMLAALAWILYGLQLLMGSMAERVMVLAAVSNYLLFFGADHVRRIGRKPKPLNVHSRTANKSRLKHACYVCGRNSKEEPRVAFRYCSKCAGGQCYCPDHLGDHEHVE